jgi:DeoR family fructose operon transcriptional repressor
LGILRADGRLPGVSLEGDKLRIVEAHFDWKGRLHVEAKKKIATYAAMLVQAESTILLDAGSTTLAIAEALVRRVDAGELRQVKVITNSVPAAYRLLTRPRVKAPDDDKAAIQVYVAGGRLRPTTLALVDYPERYRGGAADVAYLVQATTQRKADLAFVGTNGIHSRDGFTTPSALEVRTKKAFIAGSNLSFIVSDASKFDVQTAHCFESFASKRIEVIAAEDSTLSIDEPSKANPKKRQGVVTKYRKLLDRRIRWVE